MVKKETFSRLQWHAGLDLLNPSSSWVVNIEGLSSISACTWPGNAPISTLEAAISDFMATLSSLNHELNGEVPSKSTGRDENIPVNLVYAVTEVIRMLRKYQGTTTDPATRQCLSRAVWRAETAWSMVLAGDIDDIEEDLGYEETGRSG